MFVAAIRAPPGFRVEACGTRGGFGVQRPPVRNAALRGLAVFATAQGLRARCSGMWGI